MSRANVAAFKSKAANLIDILHLDHDEIAALGIALAIEHGRKAGLDRRDLHALLDDTLAATAVEGERVAP